MFFDPVYLLFVMPGILLGLWATFKTRTTFDRYSHVESAKRITGAEAASRLLSGAGIHDVRIEETDGFLSDHYDPAAKVLRLSPGVYRSDSIAAIGVACHEAGHAIQHATSYGALGFAQRAGSGRQPGESGSVYLFLCGVPAAHAAADLDRHRLLRAGGALFSGHAAGRIRCERAREEADGFVRASSPATRRKAHPKCFRPRS